MTVCIACKHYIGPKKFGHRFEHKCGASERPKHVDPVTGRIGHTYINEGVEYISYEKHETYMWCSEVNKDGNCSLYESR